ncbi:hypothetical protein GVAV_001147 [Gurleya vavrai]
MSTSAACARHLVILCLTRGIKMSTLLLCDIRLYTAKKIHEHKKRFHFGEL